MNLWRSPLASTLPHVFLSGWARSGLAACRPVTNPSDHLRCPPFFCTGSTPRHTTPARCSALLASSDLNPKQWLSSNVNVSDKSWAGGTYAGFWSQSQAEKHTKSRINFYIGSSFQWCQMASCRWTGKRASHSLDHLSVFCKKCSRLGRVTVLLKNSSWYQHTHSFWNKCTRNVRSLFYGLIQQHIRVLGVVPCSWVYLVSLFLLCVLYELFTAVFTSAYLSFHFSCKKCGLKTGAFWLSPLYLLCHSSMTGAMTVISTLTFSSIQVNIPTIHSSSISLIKGTSPFLCPFFFLRFRTWRLLLVVYFQLFIFLRQG